MHCIKEFLTGIAATLFAAAGAGALAFTAMFGGLNKIPPEGERPREAVGKIREEPMRRYRKSWKVILSAFHSQTNRKASASSLDVC